MSQEPPTESCITLVLCSDANYACHLCVTLRSALDNHRSSAPCRVFVIDGGLDETWKARVETVARSAGARLEIIKPPAEISESIPTFGYINKSAYLRLLLAQALPASVTRAIYLDCDLIVLGDIGELWEWDLKGRVFAATPDEGIECNRDGRARKLQLGLPWNVRYLNSGVLLVDVEKARATRLFEEALEFAARNPDSIRFADQDALNAVAGERAGELPAEWNAQPCHFRRYLDEKRRRSVYDTRETPPKIAHYCEKRKPWANKLNHPYANQYEKYLKRLPWAAECMPKHPLKERARWAVKRGASMIGLQWAIDNLELAYEFQMQGFVDKRTPPRYMKYVFCIVYFPYRNYLAFGIRVRCFYHLNRHAPRWWRRAVARALNGAASLFVPKWMQYGWDNAFFADRAPCDCCGSLVYSQGAIDEGAYCPVCSWRPDAAALAGTDRPSARNGLSIAQARANFARCGAYHPRFQAICRKPTLLERGAAKLRPELRKAGDAEAAPALAG